ncbi:uncharacterized protein LOC126789914 [Argentina anserina]|uniref:uncharacterized protein LOC126789914 n=1 Tax=Argentina anserina TaxID=57926 RepID=UPI0021766E3D|nr:uncharacterized protein LOC126789914 [Potentilla anserina]
MVREMGLSTPTKHSPTKSECSSSPGGNQAQKKTMKQTSAKRPAENVPIAHRKMMFKKAVDRQRQIDEIVVERRFTAGPFCLQRPLPQSDVRLIDYVFMGGKETSAEENETLVAECGDGRERMVRSALKTLAPDTPIVNEVINFICDFMSRDNPNAWYLPTWFATAANAPVAPGVSYHSKKLDTRNVCNMWRFEGRIDTCEMVFIPVHLLSGNWFLIVVHVRRRVAEVWDSAPGFTGAATAERMAVNTLRYLRDVHFLFTPLSGTNHPHDFAEYEILFPVNAPGQRGGRECGIYTIQNMQYYGQVWWDGYDGAEHRASILLQCMKYPANESHRWIQENADDLYYGRVPPPLVHAGENLNDNGDHSTDTVEIIGVNIYNPIINLEDSADAAGEGEGVRREMEGQLAGDVREDHYDTQFELSMDQSLSSK